LAQASFSSAEAKLRLVTLTHLAALALIGERVLAWTAPKAHAKLMRRAQPKHWTKGLHGRVKEVVAFAAEHPQLTAQAASLAGGVVLGRSGRKRAPSAH
jgi:hypothetical protein